MSQISIDEYIKDESAPFRSHVLTAENDEIAVKWRNQVLEKNGLSGVHTLLESCANYGRSVLDLGMSYGALYFAFKKFYPEIEWQGVEISKQYIDKFLAIESINSEELSKRCHLIDSYKNLSYFGNESVDVVISCSMLNHYTAESAFIIIDEMLRVAKRAVIIKFRDLPNKPEDTFEIGSGNMKDRGYFCGLAKEKWVNYCLNKKVFYIKNCVFVIEK